MYTLRKKEHRGEQVYFEVSKDGFNWEEVNDGNPVLWSYYGDKGVRDFTINRTKEGKFVILATDLSLSYGMLNQYHNSWAEISRNGSICLVMWESEDLIHWSSPHCSNNYGEKGIYYSRTKDFVDFMEAKLLYQKEDSGVIDSAMYEEDGKYYLFLKSEKNPAKIILMESENITGPSQKIEEFDKAFRFPYGYKQVLFWRLPWKNMKD